MHSNQTQPTRLSTGQGKTKEQFSTTSVMYFLGDGNYSQIIRKGAPIILASKSLGFYEKMLPSFIRIHKQSLVNPRFIKSVDLSDRKNAFIRMTNGRKIRVGNKRVTRLRAQLLAVSNSPNA